MISAVDCVKHPGMYQIPVWLCADFDSDFWKSLINVWNNLGKNKLLLWLLCVWRNLPVWLQYVYAVVTCRETNTLSEVCVVLLLVSYFYCILYMKLFQLKTSPKCVFAFFLVTMLAIILRTSVELLGCSYVELKIRVDTTLRLNVLSVYLKQPVINTCTVDFF